MTKVVRVRHVQGGYTLLTGDEKDDDVILVRRSVTGRLFCLYCQSGECKHVDALVRYLTNQKTDT